MSMGGRVDFGSLSLPPDNLNLGGATASTHGIMHGAAAAAAGRKWGKFFNDSVHGMYRCGITTAPACSACPAQPA